MSQTLFGPGSLYVTRTDVPGTPCNIGFVQEFSIDLSADSKDLFGQNQYPLAHARSTVKSTGKMKAAKVSGLALNSAFFAQSLAAGQLLMAQQEAAAVPATGPYTVNVANSAHFDTDLGVLYANTGLPLQKVSAVTAAGQYSVSAGVYTFYSSDSSAAVSITYAYTASASGQTMTVQNQPIGTTPTFQIDYASSYNGQAFYVRVFQAVSDKLSMQFKLTDYMMPEIDYGFFANGAGKVFEVSFADAG